MEQLRRAATLEARRPGVIYGTRTRDSQYHKLELYQLSYDHHVRRIVCQTPGPVTHPVSMHMCTWPFTADSVVGYARRNEIHEEQP